MPRPYSEIQPEVNMSENVTDSTPNADPTTNAVSTTPARISVSWDVRAEAAPPTIVLWEFQRGWTWEDFRAARQISEGLVRSVAYDVDLIFNLNKTAVPQGNTLQQLRAMSRNTSPNVGTRILTNADGFAIAIVRVGLKAFGFGPGGIGFADTVEEARAMIARRHQAN